MDSFGDGAQHNIEEGQYPANVFNTQESQAQAPNETTNPSRGGPGGRSGGRGRGSGGEASGSATASVATSKRKCKRTSAVWAHYDELEEVDNNGNIKYIAQCKYCGDKLQGNTIHGTTHLRRHSEKCLQKQGGGTELRQTQLSFDRQTGGLNTWKYDSQVDRMEIARLVATLDQPLSFAEHRNWHRYIKIVHNPNAQFFSKTTLRKDVLKLFKQEKQALINLLHSTSGCVALTADIWSAVANKDYLAVTGHYFKGFDLDKRILGFKCVLGSHSADLIYNTILGVIDEYNLRDRVMAITLDNATANTKAIEYFENDLSLFGNNDIFHQRCACHVINLVVKSGLKSMSGHLKRIRDNIAWIQSSNIRIQDWYRFVQACNQTPRALALDMPVRWNSTYIMLEQCLPYKDAITNYVSAKLGVGYIDKLDWQIAELLYNFLSRFHEVTLKLSGTYYPTSPLALGELLRMTILFCEFRTHDVLGLPIASMEKKFKKYWAKLPMLYGFGVIFDPRLKLEGLESGLDNLGEFLQIDCADQFPKIKEKIFSLYSTYECRFRNTPRVEEPQQQDEHPHSFLNVFGLKKKKKTTTQGEGEAASGSGSSSRSGGNELMAYLSEGLVVGDTSAVFDLVQWWRTRALSWPILTRMAMDIFSIPVSSVSSEQAFSTTGRILEERRNALQKDIVEALVCIKDWDRADQRLHDTISPASQEWIDEFNRLTFNFEDDPSASN